MTFHMLWVIALGLSMDSFAVSISKGLAMRAFRWKQALAIACCFGLFQGIMPAIGYVVGLQFSQMIQNWDHWIAFVLLALIGVNMIREGLSSDDEPAPSLISLKHLLTLGVATSIDALAIGVSFAFLSVDILLAVFIIGLTTFVISFIGVKSGHFFREKIQKQSRDFWRFNFISHSCENPTRTWCFLSANFRLLDYNLTNFVFFKRVIIEC